MGPGWLEARDEEGNRRLENPQDFVRIEIGTALKRGIPVIPILLEGTRIPKADQLPDDLKELPLRNGLNVRHVSFLDDLERLIRGLKREAKRRAEEAQRKAAEEAEAQETREWALARISHTTECIRAANQRKSLCCNIFSSIRGAPRCRQSVARICLDLHPLKDAKW